METFTYTFNEEEKRVIRQALFAAIENDDAPLTIQDHGFADSVYRQLELTKPNQAAAA
jgi:hypothetical protein